MTRLARQPLRAAALALALAAAAPAGAQAPPPPPPPMTENTPAWVFGVRPGGALSLRAGPGTAFPRLGRLPLGAPLRILGRMGNWLYVDVGGARGFVSGRYVSLRAPAPLPPVPPPPRPPLPAPPRP